MGEAKSYIERLFDFPAVDARDANDARRAIAEPAHSQGVDFIAQALDEIVRVTAGYPYFLQEWGHFVWRQAETSPISKATVLASHDAVIQHLDASFFRVRLDRMTPTEKRYMRAMAKLGPDAHRSGDIARIYGAKVTSVAPIRSTLISKGMIFSPGRRYGVHRAAVRRLHAPRDTGFLAERTRIKGQPNSHHRRSLRGLPAVRRAATIRARLPFHSVKRTFDEVARSAASGNKVGVRPRRTFRADAIRPSSPARPRQLLQWKTCSRSGLTNGRCSARLAWYSFLTRRNQRIWASASPTNMDRGKGALAASRRTVTS